MMIIIMVIMSSPVDEFRTIIQVAPIRMMMMKMMGIHHLSTYVGKHDHDHDDHDYDEGDHQVDDEDDEQVEEEETELFLTPGMAWTTTGNLAQAEVPVLPLMTFLKGSILQLYFK